MLFFQRIRFILLLLAFELTGAFGLIGESAAQSTPAPAALAEVDRLWRQGQFEAALGRLEALQQDQPRNAEVLWRLARVKVDLGEDATSEDRQERLYRAATEDAQAAVEAAPTSADAYVTRAIASGRVALVSGTREKVERSREVKESVDRAVELDPSNVLAYHIRGRWHYEVASLGFFSRAALKLIYGGLPNASYENAAEDLQRANEIEDLVVNHVELGKTYLKLGEEEKARAEFQRALALPSTYPNDTQYKQEARERLAEM